MSRTLPFTDNLQGGEEEENRRIPSPPAINAFTYQASENTINYAIGQSVTQLPPLGSHDYMSRPTPAQRHALYPEQDIQNISSHTLSSSDGIATAPKSLGELKSKSKMQRSVVYIEEGEYHSRSRNSCSCSPRRNPKCCMWSCCCFVFLALLGVTIYVMFPRIPNIVIGFPFVGADFNGPVMETFPNGTLASIQISLFVNFSVLSTNNWDYYLSTIDANGNLLDLNGVPIANAAGRGNMSSVTIPANSNLTYTIPLNVKWESIGLGTTKDPALLTLASCTIATPPSTFKAEYNIEAKIPLVEWTGYSLKQQGSFSFNIRNLPRDSRASILSLVRSILNATTTDI